MPKALWCLLLVGCGSADLTAPTVDRAAPLVVHSTFVAGLTAFYGDTAYFVQATQNDSTVVWVQVSIGGNVLSDVTTRVPDQSFVAGSRTGDWSLSTGSLSVTWANSGTWQKQTPKVTSQPPAENAASGSLSGRPIPPNALAFLLIEN